MGRPKKSLSQNFLTDLSIAMKIAEALPGELPILEIGPGKGVLTQYLIKREVDYRGVELDRELFRFLDGYYRAANIQFINKDILKTDLNELFENKKFNAIGNIPYNITTPIIFHLLNYKDKISEIVLMIQKEVAERMTAIPGNKSFGVLTIMTQFLSEIEFLFNVPAESFYPVPKVDSAVIRMRVRDWGPEQPENPEFFRIIVRKAFQQRRKMLRSSLKGLPLESAKIDLRLRPEQVGISDWIELSNDLYTKE